MSKPLHKQATRDNNPQKRYLRGAKKIDKGGKELLKDLRQADNKEKNQNKKYRDPRERKKKNKGGREDNEGCMIAESRPKNTGSSRG